MLSFMATAEGLAAAFLCLSLACDFHRYFLCHFLGVLYISGQA